MHHSCCIHLHEFYVHPSSVMHDHSFSYIHVRIYIYVYMYILIITRHFLFMFFIPSSTSSRVQMCIICCSALHGVRRWLVVWWSRREASRQTCMLHWSSTIAMPTLSSPATPEPTNPSMLTSPLTISFLRVSRCAYMYMCTCGGECTYMYIHVDVTNTCTFVGSSLSNRQCSYSASNQFCITVYSSYMSFA